MIDEVKSQDMREEKKGKLRGGVGKRVRKEGSTEADSVTHTHTHEILVCVTCFASHHFIAFITP